MTGKPWQEQPRESGRFSFTSKKESDVDLPVETPADASAEHDAAPTATVAPDETGAQQVATEAPAEQMTRAQLLIDSSDPADRAEAIDDPDLSPEQLETLIHDMDTTVRARVATSGHYGVAAELSRDSSAVVRALVQHAWDLEEEDEQRLRNDPQVQRVNRLLFAS